MVYDGLLDGGSGNDTLSFSDCNTSINVILTGHGNEDGFRGIESSLKAGFTNLDQVIGSKAADDVLTGRNTAATFILDDICIYSNAGRAISFSGFGVLQGGSGNDVFEIHGERAFILFGGAGDDTFVFCDGATLEGSIDGQAGRNTLDFADYTTSRNFTLTGIGGNNGFTGKEAALSGEFKNIVRLVGGQDTDALAGLNAPAVWELTGNGGVYAAESRQLEFNGIETVIGGADQDSFVVGSDAARKGNIDGRSGVDTLNFSQWLDDLLVKLARGYATGITGGISAIVNVTGGSGDDDLTGDSSDNVLIGNGGNDTLRGEDGND
ncbi:MAG: hypothetical protein PHV56_04430, partial [Clostridia bacterium]|nr:hypothetical protein [Clostridia bacterium]